MQILSTQSEFIRVFAYLSTDSSGTCQNVDIEVSNKTDWVRAMAGLIIRWGTQTSYLAVAY